MKKPTKILVLTYWSYNDALIQTYTLPYLKIINEVLEGNCKIYLQTLEKDITLTENNLSGINNQLSKDNIELIPFGYKHFGLLAAVKTYFYFIRLWFYALFKGVDYIHSFCTPAGGLGYLLSIFTGKPLILDSYEPHAEPMVESGTWKKDGIKFKILFWLEKLQGKRAKHIITCVAKMKEYAETKYGIKRNDYHVKPACIDFSHFKANEGASLKLKTELGLDGKVIGLYVGKFGGSYLKEEVFELMKVAYDKWGDDFRFLILTNHSTEEIDEMCKKAGLNRQVVINRFVPHQEVPNYVGLANFGVTPFIPVPSKRYGTPIKTGEYMAMGLPIIITKDISDDSDTIKQNDIGYVLEELNQAEYTKAIEHIGSLIKDEATRNKCIKVAKEYRSFDKARDIYIAIFAA